MSIRDQLHILMAINQSPIMLIGPHGVGKSAMIASIAKQINYHMLDIRLSQYSEGDILGIPYQTSEGTTRFYPPDIFKIAKDIPCVLFLDELNRASKEVRQAVFQLADSRRLGSLEVHPSTIIVSACNPDDSSYQVHTLDPAELDRWFVFEFNPSVAEWLGWAGANGVCDVIRDYISTHPHDLDPAMANTTVANGPSRRSWTRFSNSITAYPRATGQEIDADMIRFMATGFLGTEVGASFHHYFVSYQKKGVFAKVLEGSLKELPIDVALSLPSDIEDAGLRVSTQFSNNQNAINNLVAAMKTLPVEIREATLKSVKKNCVAQFSKAVVAMG